MTQVDTDRAMVVVAHPDDAEFSAGGTVAKWAKGGTEVVYVIVTDGSKGSSDRDMTSERLIALRRQEQRAAADVLGVADVIFLDFVDGEVMPDLALRHRLTRVIREVQPDTVVTHDPASLYWDEYINHPDHRAVGQATLDAIFPTARDHLNVPDLLQEGLEPHVVRNILLSSTKHADLWIDVGDTLDLKIESLRRHVSQFKDFDMIAERVKERLAEIGRDQGMEYAESFKRITLQ